MTVSRRLDALVWAFAALLTVTLLGLAVTGETGDPRVLPAYGLLAVMGGLAATLSRLSARVQGGVLSVWLGPGLFRQSCPLAEIAGVRSLHLHSPSAVGLRLLPDGWLYSIGGADFTEVRLRDGRRLLIGLGSDSGLPDALHSTLRR